MSKIETIFDIRTTGRHATVSTRGVGEEPVDDEGIIEEVGAAQYRGRNTS